MNNPTAASESIYYFFNYKMSNTDEDEIYFIMAFHLISNKYDENCTTYSLYQSKFINNIQKKCKEQTGKYLCLKSNLNNFAIKELGHTGHTLHNGEFHVNKINDFTTILKSYANFQNCDFIIEDLDKSYVNDEYFSDFLRNLIKEQKAGIFENCKIYANYADNYFDKFNHSPISIAGNILDKIEGIEFLIPFN